MQNKDDQNTKALKKQNRLALKKSFLNFTLRHFITLYNKEIPQDMIKEWQQYKKFGIKILQYIISRDKENNTFFFANFLRYQLPSLIIQGKIQEKNQYFIYLKELIEKDKFNFSEDVKQNLSEEQKEKKNRRNYLTLIGRKIAKKNNKQPQNYYGKKFIQEIVTYIQKIKNQQDCQPNEILEKELNELLNQEQCIDKKNKLEKRIKIVNEVIKKIKFNPQQ